MGERDSNGRSQAGVILAFAGGTCVARNRAPGFGHGVAPRAGRRPRVIYAAAFAMFLLCAERTSSSLRCGASMRMKSSRNLRK